MNEQELKERELKEQQMEEEELKREAERKQEAVKDKETEPIKVPTGIDLNEIQAEAERVMKEEDVMSYFRTAYKVHHAGDEDICDAVLLAIASSSIKNSVGIHVIVLGERGKGKSHAIATALSMLPDEYHIRGSMSDKAIFYMDLKESSVFDVDDTTFSLAMQELFKASQTRFQDGYEYTTVIHQKPMKLYVAPRCVWILSKTEDPGDEQFMNRLLVIWADDSSKQDMAYVGLKANNESKKPSEMDKEDKSILVCREIIRKLKEMPPVYVVTPFAHRIRFADIKERRNIELFYELVKAAAVLNYFKKEMKKDGDIEYIESDLHDFEIAASLFMRLHGVVGSISRRLTPMEDRLLTYLFEHNVSLFTITDIIHWLKISYATAHRVLHGRQDVNQSYHSGVMKKCPALTFEDVSEKMGETESVRKKRFKFDRALYEQWDVELRYNPVYLEEERVEVAK